MQAQTTIYTDMLLVVLDLTSTAGADQDRYPASATESPDAGDKLTASFPFRKPVAAVPVSNPEKDPLDRDPPCSDTDKI